MTIRLGITGGIGSGKSVVSRLLQTMGVPVYLTDNEAKRLTNENPVIRQQLIALAGNETYLPDGTLNRPHLAAFLFGQAEHAAQVNAIIHPHVKEDFKQWVRAHTGCPVVAIESAILIEAGFTDVVDKVIMVYAPLELRIQRAMLRDNASEEAIRQRILRQMNDEAKCRMAHTIIKNDNLTPLIPQVLALLQEE